MSDWKELKIDDLPADILVGDYEFRHMPKMLNDEEGIYKNFHDPIVLIKEIRDWKSVVEYRPRQPEPPTHEEIMTKWWFFESGNWERVTAFNPVEYEKGKHCYRTGEVGWSTKNSFTGRQSADVPPEV